MERADRVQERWAGLMRRGATWGTCLVLAIALGWGGWWIFRHLRAASRLEAGIAAMDEGDFAAAAIAFRGVLLDRPSDDEAAYRLGFAESSRGELDAALAAWERIGPSSPYATAASARLAPLLLERGQYARAEERLRRVIGAGGPEAASAREQLTRVLRFQDRRDEARALLRQELRLAPDPARVLRELWLLDFEAVAVERAAALLRKAHADAPRDDRVWLGLAGLERRAGRLDAAEKWLRDCLAARPDDPVVWLAWLAWAREADRLDEARRALAHIPARRVSRVELARFRVWLSRRLQDPRTERRELEALRTLDPDAPGALERLAELDTLEGQPARATEHRRAKADLDRAREDYHRLFDEPDARLVPRASELARLARTLGRHDEARGWWTLRLRAHPNDAEARDALARLERPASEAASSDPKATLADLTADLTATSSSRASEPLTAAPPTPPAFVDISESAGLSFTFDQGLSPQRQLPETMSGGVGLIDHDGDGWLDVYCVQGGPLLPKADASRPGDRLFRNRGDGSFEDVTERSGIAAFPRGYGHGVAVGDIDGNGHPDIFVTRFGSYALYRNRGDGTFEDATRAAGLDGPRGWPTSAALADLDGDGDLDLYVCHYLRWDPEHPTTCLGTESRRPEYCAPREFEAEPDHLFRNDGGRFVDVTAEAGIVDSDGRGLGVVAADLDGDGRVDLFVANDTTANLAFFNQGGLRFREAGLESGLAANATSGFLAGMGVACGDSDGDGRPDLVVTNFYDEATTFYRNLGGGFFADQSAAVGTALASRYLLGFGVAFFDYDDDGRLDLITANGHVNDSRPLYPHAMPIQLLAGRPGGRFEDVSARAGAPLTDPRIGRGLAVGDLDNDGRLDLVVVSQGEPLALLRNRTEGGHSLTLRLDPARPHRDTVGAKVVVTAGGRRQTHFRVGGGSYLSASDARIHIGLGPALAADRVEITWPSGRIDVHENLAAGRAHVLRERMK